MIADARSRFTLVGRDQKGNLLRGWAETTKTYSDRWFVYVCPACKGETALEWSDFVRHAGKLSSNLKPSDDRAIEREAEGQLTTENSFVDFYCAGCRSSVRAYYHYESVDRGYDSMKLKTVVEHRQSVPDDRSLRLPF